MWCDVFWGTDIWHCFYAVCMVDFVVAFVHVKSHAQCPQPNWKKVTGTKTLCETSTFISWPIVFSNDRSIQQWNGMMKIAKSLNGAKDTSRASRALFCLLAASRACTDCRPEGACRSMGMLLGQKSSFPHFPIVRTNADSLDVMPSPTEDEVRQVTKKDRNDPPDCESEQVDTIDWLFLPPTILMEPKSCTLF